MEFLLSGFIIPGPGEFLEYIYHHSMDILKLKFNDRILDRIVNTLLLEVFHLELVWICMKHGSRYDGYTSVHSFGVFTISQSYTTTCNV